MMLVEDLEALVASDLDFDLGGIGCEVAEIDRLIDGFAPDEDSDPEDHLLRDGAPSRVWPDDLGQLGLHRLI